MLVPRLKLPMSYKFVSISRVWQAAGAATTQHVVTAMQLGAASVVAAPVIIELLAENVLLCLVCIGSCLTEVPLTAF